MLPLNSKGFAVSTAWSPRVVDDVLIELVVVLTLAGRANGDNVASDRAPYGSFFGLTVALRFSRICFGK